MRCTINQLKDIALFSNVDETLLKECVECSQIITYEKDQHIFFLDDATTKFYIIEKGMVRTYYLDDKGNESTLQLLTPHHFIKDILSDNALAAQAIDNCSIIEFPAKHIKAALEKHPTFAMNFVQSLMVRNKELLAQLSRSRLLSAKEKLGRFLLALSFEKNGKKSLKIDLHISKSMIASYLGMNLETFSRSLKKLKDDNDIAITGNKITFLQESSLCDYCDEEIGSTCNNRGENYCKFD